MNRNKLNIRMDLMRVVKTALEIDKPFEKAIAYMFLDKALQEFESNLPKETLLKNELQLFNSQIDDISNDPLKRIRWGEKVMTIASRLGSI